MGDKELKAKIKNPILQVTLGENIKKTNIPTDTWMIERSWHVARIQTNPTMCLTLDFARQKWEESGRKVELAKIILQNVRPPSLSPPVTPGFQQRSYGYTGCVACPARHTRT